MKKIKCPLCESFLPKNENGIQSCQCENFRFWTETGTFWMRNDWLMLWFFAKGKKSGRWNLRRLPSTTIEKLSENSNEFLTPKKGRKILMRWTTLEIFK